MPRSPDLETRLYRACGQSIPADRYPLHERGLDGAQPECPKQDLAEIALRQPGEWWRSTPVGWGWQGA